MRLSLTVGRLDWWNIDAELEPQQLAAWEMYDALEGIGPLRDDIRTAHQTMKLLACHGVESCVMDHLYDIDSQQQERSEEEVDTLSLVCAAFNVPVPARLPNG